MRAGFGAREEKVMVTLANSYFSTSSILEQWAKRDYFRK